jgi:hypothetical protein
MALDNAVLYLLLLPLSEYAFFIKNLTDVGI